MSSRQFAVFLVCYNEDGLHTVRGLSVRLGVSKPAITRALDRLVELGLAGRTDDPRDRRSVLVQRTRAGMEFLADLHGLLQRAAGNATARPLSAARLSSPSPAI